MGLLEEVVRGGGEANLVDYHAFHEVVRVVVDACYGDLVGRQVWEDCDFGQVEGFC